MHKAVVSQLKDGISLSVYVQPGASKSQWAGLHEGSLKLRIQARPVEGQANNAVIQFVAKWLEVPKSAVSIVKGNSSRNKIVHVRGDASRLQAKVDGLLSGS